MDWGGLLLLAVVMGLLLRLVLQRVAARPTLEAEEPAYDVRTLGDRVSQLVGTLSGDSRRDRAIQNQLLALGSSAVPQIVVELREQLKSPSAFEPTVIARVEEVIADNGLAAMPTLVSTLSMISPSSPLATSLMRIIRKLGAPAGVQIIDAAAQSAPLSPYVPRLRSAAFIAEPDALVRRVLRDTRKDGRARFEATNALIFAHPGAVLGVFERWSAPLRLEYLHFVADWMPLATVPLLSLALNDEDAVVRVAAVEVASLSPGLDLDDLLLERLRADPSVSVRLAACEAWAFRAVGLSSEGGSDAVAEALSGVAAEADGALVGAAVFALLLRGAEFDKLPDHLGEPMRSMAVAVLSGDADPLIEVLDTTQGESRLRAAALLGRLLPLGPRSEERLIRAAEDRDVEVAALAVLGLAKAEAPTAIELLVKSIRDETTPFASRRLRCAALRLGAASVAPLARRVHGDGGQRSAHLLSILRAVPFGQGVPSLLRALDASRGTLLERDLCATLAMGDLEVVHAIRAALEHPGRGLLTAALTYLSAYATVDDIPLLIGLVDRHPPLRGILLILLEAQGLPARDALSARIALGGEDGLLIALEQRVKLLDACG